MILAIVFFVSYAYFYEAGGWNQNTRFDLTRAIVERGELKIDAYHTNTGDKALRDGHYYSDKAPGSSLIGAPAVVLTRLAIKLLGHDPDHRANVVWQSYVATLAAAAIPGVVAALFLFGLARRWGASDNQAAISCLIFGLGTPFWAYATLMWGHALAGACLIAGLYFADRLRDPPAHQRQGLLFGAAVGLACGWAVVTEYPSAGPALAIAILSIINAFAGDRSRGWRVGAAMVAGAAVCGVVLLMYQQAAFGSPWRIGYQNEEQSELLARGFFGITVPSIAVMRELLFGSYRGLLPLAPVLALAPFGWWLARRSPMRWTMVTAAACTLYYLLLNAAYQHWEGGWTYGPRHLGAVLAFLCLGLVPVMTHGNGKVRGLLLALSPVGAVLALAAVSTMSQPPSTLFAPVTGLIWPQFLDGQLATNLQSIFDVSWPAGASPAAWNLGQKMGLEGLESLAPLLVIYLGAYCLWCRPVADN